MNELLHKIKNKNKTEGNNIYYGIFPGGKIEVIRGLDHLPKEKVHTEYLLDKKKIKIIREFLDRSDNQKI